jgi:hypothetical protein
VFDQRCRSNDVPNSTPIKTELVSSVRLPVVVAWKPYSPVNLEAEAPKIAAAGTSIPNLYVEFATGNWEIKWFCSDLDLDLESHRAAPRPSRITT